MVALLHHAKLKAFVFVRPFQAAVHVDSVNAVKGVVVGEPIADAAGAEHEFSFKP